MFEYQATSYIAGLKTSQRLDLDEKLIIQPISDDEIKAVSSELRGEPFLMASISCSLVAQFCNTNLAHVLIEGRKIAEKVISFLKLYGGGAPQIVAHCYKVLSDKPYNPAEDFGGKIIPHNHERYWGEFLKINSSDFEEIKNL